MMIFYDRQSGEIVGTVKGRVHSPEEMKMWVGDKDTTERIVCEWKPIIVGDKKVI